MRSLEQLIKYGRYNEMVYLTGKIMYHGGEYTWLDIL